MFGSFLKPNRTDELFGSGTFNLKKKRLNARRPADAAAASPSLSHALSHSLRGVSGQHLTLTLCVSPSLTQS
ncbi:hypothetical protein WN944_000843 [Citrus x changshan-huyou]|uniref:Uncharacterized protein n=1 Tax=Citrus x changshan-huyou TaxID=2935761 RepID=A0AAP0MIL6_9ROSI